MKICSVNVGQLHAPITGNENVIQLEAVDDIRAVQEVQAGDDLLDVRRKRADVNAASLIKGTVHTVHCKLHQEGKEIKSEYL